MAGAGVVESTETTPLGAGIDWVLGVGDQSGMKILIRNLQWCLSRHKLLASWNVVPWQTKSGASHEVSLGTTVLAE